MMLRVEVCVNRGARSRRCTRQYAHGLSLNPRPPYCQLLHIEEQLP